MTESALGKNLLALITESHPTVVALLTHPKTTINVSTRIKMASLLTTEISFQQRNVVKITSKHVIFFIFAR